MMKKLTLLALLPFFVNGADAQTVIQVPTMGDGYYNALATYYMNKGTTQSQAPTFSKVTGTWLRPDDGTGWIENATQEDGIYTLQRGYEATLTLYLGNTKIDGRLYESPNGAAAIASHAGVTTIISENAVITGKNNDRTAAAQSKLADNAISIGPGNKNCTSWVFERGTFIGGRGFSGIAAQKFTGFTSRGASFIGGALDDQTIVVDEEGNESGLKSMASGGAIATTGAITIGNHVSINGTTTNTTISRFIAANAVGGNYLRGGGYNKTVAFKTGEGLTAVATGAITINDGVYSGSRYFGGAEQTINNTKFDTFGNKVSGTGGNGAFLQGSSINIDKGIFTGGDAYNVNVGGPNSTAVTVGGYGAVVIGGGTIKNAEFYAGASKRAAIVAGSYYTDVETKEIETSDNNGKAYADGASGLYFGTGTMSLDNVKAVGSAGSSARANETNAVASARGGDGVTANGTTLTIQSGTYSGANGGFAFSGGTGNANGGAGVLALNGTLTVNGGTFTGGAAGSLNNATQLGNVGIWSENATLTIQQASTNTPTVVNGNVVISNPTTAKVVKILGGNITGDLYFIGKGITTLTVSTNATYNGSFIQTVGTVNTTLTNPNEGKFFSDVYIGAATNNITGKLLTAENARIVLGSQRSRLNILTGGLELSEGASVNAGYGQVKVTTGDLILRDNASLTYSFDSLNNVGGLFDVVAGNLVVSNANVKIVAEGISSTPTGSVKVVKSTGVVLGGNSLDDIVDVDFGWLTTRTGSSANGGITVDYGYSSLTNTSLKDLDNSLLTMIDGVITNLGTSEFYALNAGGAAEGTSMFRYSLSQMPDVSESSFQVSQKVSEQIAARGTEFRSMNGFASSQPRLGQKAPAGAAGPGQDKDMQGWVRAYGAFGNRESDGNFTAYDSDTWGSVIGVDKSFGNILVGLAGGYARTDIDGGGTYEAKVDTFHGSVYSTIGGESLFLDLAATYARANTEEHNAADPKGSEFDSDVYSGYIGLGKSFDLGEKLSLTPEASLLATYYDQQSYDRSSVGGIGGTVESYDTWSYMGTLGASVSTLHQIDWMNRGLALVPEVRAHWLHDFNADPEDFTFNIAGTPYVFGVRPREEDLLRIGFGFDIWNWKFQSTKFEIDYDALLADKYYEHILSGKISVRF